MLPAERELTTEYDHFAVVVENDGEILGQTLQALFPSTIATSRKELCDWYLHGSSEAMQMAATLFFIPRLSHRRKTEPRHLTWSGSSVWPKEYSVCWPCWPLSTMYVYYNMLKYYLGRPIHWGGVWGVEMNPPAHLRASLQQFMSTNLRPVKVHTCIQLPKHACCYLQCSKEFRKQTIWAPREKQCR